MEKKIVEIVEELKDGYCEKSYHKYSPFTKFIVNECIKAAENDHIDDIYILNEYSPEYSSTDFVAALLWAFNRAKEEGFVIDYMNDNMTFLYDSKILKVAGRNGLGIEKYYDHLHEDLFINNKKYIQRMKDDIIPKLDEEAVDFIELFCCECTDNDFGNIEYDIVGKGYLWVENPAYELIAEIIIRINVLYEDLSEHTNTGKEYDILELMKCYIYNSHYDNIRNNIIDGLEKPYSLDRVKVGRIYKLLYRMVIYADETYFEEYFKGDTVKLPVIVVEYLYLLLILRSNEFNHDKVYTPFATGDVNQIEDQMLLELEGLLVMETEYYDYDEIEDFVEFIDNLFNKYTSIQL